MVRQNIHSLREKNYEKKRQERYSLKEFMIYIFKYLKNGPLKVLV